MADITLTTEIAPEDEIPDMSTVTRSGQWSDAVIAAAEDGKVRVTRGIPESLMDKTRRQLSHTAGAVSTTKYPNGAGVRSRVKEGALYWQVCERAVRTPKPGANGAAKAQGTARKAS